MVCITMRYSKDDERKGNILGVVIGMLCMLIGLYVLYVMAARQLIEADLVSSYQAVDAFVTNTEVKKSHGHKGFVYKVVASYHYHIDGNEYVASRIGLLDVEDADPTWHNSWHTTLSNAKASNQPITAYVNPDDPHQAILDRTLRLDRIMAAGMIAFVFCGIGAFIVYRVVTVKIVDGSGSITPDDSYRDTARSFDRPAHSSATTVFVLVIMLAVGYFFYSLNVNDTHRKDVATVTEPGPIQIDTQLDDYRFRRTLPGSVIVLPAAFPGGAAKPDFCNFNEMNSNESKNEYALFGNMGIGVYQAGNRINAHMVKSHWEPVDFIKQSDSVAMIYTDGDLELTYMFFANKEMPNDCHVMWRRKSAL